MAQDISAPSRRGAMLLAAACVLGLLWAARRVPIPAGWLSLMLPWCAERPAAAGQSWDSLWWDGVAQFYSWRWAVADALRRGELALWSPWNFCGQPLAANAQSAVFYPPNLLALALLPVPLAMSALWVFHALLAGGFTWLLARRLGAGPLGSAVAACSYALGGFMLAWAPVPSLMQSAAWLPACLWAVEAIAAACAPAAPLLAMFLAAAPLAGHMQVSGYVWLCTAVWALVRIRSWRAAASVAGAFAAALAIAAVQLLPTLELAQLSPRGALKPSPAGFEFAKLLALKPRHLLTLFWPTALGHPLRGTYQGWAFAEHYLHCGLLAVPLAAAALCLRRRPALAIAAGLAFVLWFAAGGLPAKLMYFHGGFLGQTAGFQRLTFAACLLLALLAGLGADAVAARLPAASTALAAAVAASLLGPLFSLLPLSSPASCHPPSDTLNALAALAGHKWRMLCITPRAQWRLDRLPAALAPPNTLAPYRLQDVQGYDSLYPALFKRAAAKWEGADPSPPANGNMVLLQRPAGRELGELAVRYVLAMEALSAPGLHELASDELTAPPGVFAYRNDLALPRWRMRGGRVLSADSGYNWLKLTAQGPGPLELADLPYPGWRCFVDGRLSAWKRGGVTGLVRQVSVAAGTHTVVWIFWPATVAVGAFIALAGLAASCGWLLACLRAKAV